MPRRVSGDGPDSHPTGQTLVTEAPDSSGRVGYVTRHLVCLVSISEDESYAGNQAECRVSGEQGRRPSLSVGDRKSRAYSCASWMIGLTTRQPIPPSALSRAW